MEKPCGGNGCGGKWRYAGGGIMVLFFQMWEPSSIGECFIVIYIVMIEDRIAIGSINGHDRFVAWSITHVPNE